ncbi:MAG TPA: hypothetical protein VKW09_00120 [bacterium]|nr:hypothetical protein [bacterium]
MRLGLPSSSSSGLDCTISPKGSPWPLRVAAAGLVPSWGFLATAGLIGGGPTFLGTVIGFRVNSPQAFVLLLALAAGALFYVIGEMFAVGRRFQQPPASAWGIVIGFLAAYATDLILTIDGA